MQTKIYRLKLFKFNLLVIGRLVKLVPPKLFC